MIRYVALTLAFLMASQATVWAQPATLEAAIRELNPELKTFDARIAESEAKVGPAGSLPDPRLTLELMDPMTFGGPRASLSQMLPLQGQPGLMADMAALEVAMLRAERDERALMLTADGAQALWDLAYVRRVSAILGRTEDLLNRMARVSEAKYAVGSGMQPDILRAHVARTKLNEPRLNLESTKQSAAARLGALVPGYTAPAVDLKPAGSLPPLASYIERAERQSPMLRMRRLAIRHAELGVQLAQAERFPDLELGASAGRTMPGDMPYVGGMASLSLPIWLGSKQNRRVEVAEQKARAEQAALEAARRELIGRISATYAQARAMQQQLEVYRGGLLMQAQQTFKATLAAYQVNQGDFLMVLDSQMALYDVEMAEAMALAERQKMGAMLDALSGGAATTGEGTP